MTEDKKLVINGYHPEITEKGYQPSKLQGVHVPVGEPPVQGGYQPTSEGDNPANQPSPPGDE